MKRIIVTVLLLSTLALMLSGCVQPDFEYSPERQINKQWESNDGLSLIDTYQNGAVFGYITTNDKKIPVMFCFDGHCHLRICEMTQEGSGEELVFAEVPYFKETTFKAIIKSTAIDCNWNAEDEIIFEVKSEPVEFDISEYMETNGTEDGSVS